MEQRFLGFFLHNTEPLGKLATVRFNFMFGGTLSFKTLYFLHHRGETASSFLQEEFGHFWDKEDKDADSDLLTLRKRLPLEMCSENNSQASAKSFLLSNNSQWAVFSHFEGSTECSISNLLDVFVGHWILGWLNKGCQPTHNSGQPSWQL